MRAFMTRCGNAVVLCMLLLTACSQQEGKFITKLDVATVQNESIPTIEDAKSVSRSKKNTSLPGQTIIIITYTTSQSVDNVKNYHRQVMQDHDWEPHFIGSVMQDVQPDDLIFGKAGQDGGQPGDSMVYRHVSLSIKTCMQETCVTITDMVYRTTLPDNFN